MALSAITGTSFEYVGQTVLGWRRGNPPPPVVCSVSWGVSPGICQNSCSGRSSCSGMKWIHYLFKVNNSNRSCQSKMSNMAFLPLVPRKVWPIVTVSLNSKKNRPHSSLVSPCSVRDQELSRLPFGTGPPERPHVSCPHPTGGNFGI